LDLFAWLLVGHLVGDFVLQTGWMAREKDKKPAALAVHSAVYALAAYGFSFMAGGLRWPALVVLLASHAFLDQRGFVEAWVRLVNGAERVHWLKVMVDQAFHVLVLAAVAQYFRI